MEINISPVTFLVVWVGIQGTLSILIFLVMLHGYLDNCPFPLKNLNKIDL